MMKDWNKMTTDEYIEHLENEFQFLSSGTAKSVLQLIASYKSLKKEKEELKKSANINIKHLEKCVEISCEEQSSLELENTKLKEQVKELKGKDKKLSDFLCKKIGEAKANMREQKETYSGYSFMLGKKDFAETILMKFTNS